MAKAPKPPPRPRPGSSTASWTPMWLSVIFVLVVVVSLPSVVLLAFGLLPSLVAFIVDRTKQKYATYCVTGMNLSGTFPYLLELWEGDHSLSGATAILTDIFKLFTMYGAAAVGWAMFIAVPPTVAAVLTVMSQRRVALLRSLVNDLVAEWGEDVRTPPTLLATAPSAGAEPLVSAADGDPKRRIG